MTESPAWTDRVRLDQIGQGLSRNLTASAAQRAEIAGTLDLASLDRLEAKVDIKPSGIGWRLTGHLVADVVQTCGVTLEPLTNHIEADFSVDLAAYVVEHLALEIDPWPRKPGVVFEAPEGPAEPSPFDVLRELKSKS